ncbi:MAG: ribosome biogenesis GTP-binding protein YihA/YsxC [Erysipelotrichaceae bacterium]
MIINSAELVISAAKMEQWPNTTYPEVVFAGRSNVGKSSLINAITQRKKLAYVGNTPGKTRLINFFLINEAYMFVDVPGYGYAHIGKQYIAKFGEMMEDYFNGRSQKRGMLLLVDSRHKPTADDQMMLDFARYYNLPTIIAVTKMDKLKNSEKTKQINLIRTTLKLREEEKTIPFSTESKLGTTEIWEELLKMFKS